MNIRYVYRFTLFYILATETCIDKDVNCPGWASFCGNDPYVDANCFKTCNSGCPGKSVMIIIINHEKYSVDQR